MGNTRPDSQPSAVQIRAQRDRILASKLFALSNRLRVFLDFIINASLDNKADRLKEFTLGIEVFERDETFDPSIDSIVRVEASRLRAKLREYYDGEGRDDLIRVEIPKGHYAPAFHFQNPDSVKDRANEQGLFGQSWSINRASAAMGFVVILFASAILYVVIDRNLSNRDSSNITRVVDDMSVAVLPFLPLSSGPDDGYFADGLTEEILNSLGQVRELRVTARTSSFFFKGKNMLVPEIAASLGVANVVEGSVRRDGERLRIAVQLVRAEDNSHLWSQTYDRTRDDVFAVQEEIAEKITEVMGVVLDDAAREIMHSTGIYDVEAFIAYQKGQEAYLAAHQGMNMSDALKVANSNFNSALQAAPNLTNARTMKADLRGHVLYEITGGIRDEQYPGELAETLAALREEYRLAIEQSPLGNQRDILELESTLFSENWSILLARIGKAVEASDCSEVNWTNAFISPFGWGELLSTKFRDWTYCDPLNAGARFHLAWSLIWSGDSDAALRVVAEAEDKGLSHPYLDDGRFWALLASGRVDDAATLGPGIGAGNMPFNRQILREAMAGNRSTAQQLADEYWSGPNTNDISSLMIAAATGDQVRANDVAARIDALPGSAVSLATATFLCFCGAPFDIDATPNYKSRIDESGLTWPPLTRINYPAKGW